MLVDRARLAALAELLDRPDRGGLLVIPTESSYGLAADPRSAAGVAAIFRLKGRDGGKALPVVAADRSQVVALGVAPDLPLLDRLEHARSPAEPPLWPGPLTAVLPIARPLPATAGEATVAVRIPGHAGLRRLLSLLGRPLTATSANRSGAAPVLDPDEAEALVADAAAEVVVIDGGTLPGGPPSTIVRPAAGRAEGGAGEAPGIEILREGAVPSEEVTRRLGAF